MALDPSTDRPVDDNGLSHFWTKLEGLLSSKQSKLIAGKNISFSGSTINATFEDSETVIPVNPSPVPSANGSVYLASSNYSDTGFNVLTYYPVGSIYLTATYKNPSTFLGGTWTQVSQGRALVGCGTGTDIGGATRTFGPGINSTDDPGAADCNGAYTVTLSESNLPAHTHSYYRPAATVKPRSGSGVTASGVRTSYNSGSTGGGESHNNVQPSYGIYVWQRTA